MSARSVSAAIANALQTSQPGEQPRLTAREARSVLREAEEGRLTDSESSQLGALYARGNSAGEDAIRLDEAAAQELNGFFFANDLPYGNAGLFPNFRPFGVNHPLPMDAESELIAGHGQEPGVPEPVI
jgi:hypothetical protein